MGSRMAANLLNAGFEVAVHDLARGAGDALVEGGARWADSPADCSDHADVVLTSLPGPPEVTAVVRGDSGLVSGMTDNAVWVDLSTNDPAVFRELADQLAAKGVRSLDAPVTGGIDGARSGTLTVMVGGDGKTVLSVQPVLDAISANVFHMGPLGAGMAAKLIVQQLYYVNIAALGEALTLGAGAGCETPRLLDLLKASVADSYAVQHDVPNIIDGSYDPSFSLDLTVKDLRLVEALAAAFETQGGATLALTRETIQAFEHARSEFGGSAGWLSVVRWMEDASGLQLGDRPSP